MSLVESRMSPKINTMTNDKLRHALNPVERDERRLAQYQLRVYNEQAYRDYKDGKEIIDFLALEEPLIKKRIQRQEQRKRLRRTTMPYIRSQRSMCFLRAREWLDFYNYPFFHLPDGTMVRREIGPDGKERKGAAVVGRTSNKAKLKKDKTSPRFHTFQLWLLNNNRMGITKPKDTVPQPTTLITGWERGEVEHKARRNTGVL